MRLREYWHPLCGPEGVFRPGVHINDVWMRYGFDRKMRLLMLDAIERIEVCIRAKIARIHAFHHGAYGYVNDPASLLTASGRVSRSAVIERIRKDGMLESRDELWHAPYSIPNNRIFSLLSICKYMLDVIEPSSGWSYRLSCLMHDYPEIPLHPMGMRQKWYVHALWDECRMIP